LTVENKQVKANPTGLRCGAHAQIAFTNFRGQKASSAPTLRNLSYSPQAPQDRRTIQLKLFNNDSSNEWQFAS